MNFLVDVVECMTDVLVGGLITMDGGKSFRDEKVARASRTGRKWTDSSSKLKKV